MKNLPLARVYQLLEPGPVVLLTTANKGPQQCHDYVLAHDGGVRARRW